MAVITSPCVRNCCLDKQDVCPGCGRTVEEVIRWGDADDAEKQQILEVSKKGKRIKGDESI